MKSETLYAWASSENRSEECLEIEATAATSSSKIHKEAAGNRLRSTPKANPTGTPNPRGTWKPISDEEHDFFVELRIQRTPQDAVREDQGRMTKKNQDLLDKLRTEYRTESVIADLSKTREFNRFNEESKQEC